LRTGTFATGMHLKRKELLPRAEAQGHGSDFARAWTVHTPVQVRLLKRLDEAVEQDQTAASTPMRRSVSSSEVSTLLSGSRTTGPGGRFIVRMRAWIR
jgi:hypothetical protein